MAANRSIAGVLRILRAFIAIAAVGSVALAARLTHGPIDLALVKPTIEATLTEAFAGGDVAVNRMILRAGDGRVAVVAFGVEATGADGAVIARASRVEIALNPAELLRGEIRPSRLDLLNARVTAVRSADGRLSLNLLTAVEDPDRKRPSTDLAAFLREWMAGAREIGDLPEVRLQSAALIALDAQNGEVLWEGIADAGATLAPNRALIWAEIGRDQERQTPPVNLSATLARGEGGDVAVAFDKIDLATAARVARLFGMQAPVLEGEVDGTARVTIDVDLEPRNADLALTGADLFGAFPGGRRVDIDQAAIEASIDVENRTVLFSGIRLGRNGAGLVGAATVRQPSKGALTISGRIDHADIGYTATLAGLSDAIAGLDADVTVDFDIGLAAGALATAEARVVAKGRIDLPDALYEPIDLQRVEAFIGYHAYDRTLTLRGIDADVAGVQLAGETTATFKDEGLDRLDARLRTGRFATAVLPRIWPKAFSPGGRAWVERNILKGEIGGADILISKARDGDIQATGAFTGEGLEVRYWDAMPIATGISGKAEFAGDTLTFEVDKGASAGLTTNRVKVELSKLGQPTEFIAIDGRIRGPAPKLLAVLDRKPLRYAQWLGVKPEETKGRIDGRIRLRFPLIDKLSVDDLAISADGTARDAVMPGVVKGWDLHARTIAIDVDAERLKVEGEGELLDEPLTFSGDLLFGPGEERARFKGVWRLTRDVRRELGLGADAVRRRLTGVTPATFDVIARSQDVYEIGVNADLTAATLLAQEVGWLKPKGAPANLRARAVIKDGAPIRIDDIELTAPDLSVLADVAFDPGTGKVSKVAVRRLQGAGHDLAGEVTLTSAGDRVRVYGRRADLRPLMELDRSAKDPSRPEPPPDPHPRRFEIDVVEARVSENMRLRGLKADLTLQNDWPTAIDASATYDGGALTLAKSPTKPKTLLLTATDFGRLLAAGAITDGILGGAATVEIEGRGDGVYGVEGHVRDFDFAKAEIEDLAGESAKPLLGILGGGEAVRFDRLDIFARYQDGMFTIDKGRAGGAALGMSARGEVDLKSRAIDVNGAISPAYAISRVIGGIPILGDLLTGSRREGVFAANYRASGDLDSPSFRIDGLSAFAPGILREALPPPGEGRPPPKEPEFNQN